MKVSAIICEYNPLHKGHLYQLECTRAAGATHIVGILSGNFVQRGDVALLDKFDRASLAMQAGMDLVIELPSVYALSAAEHYARAGISILRQLGGVQELSFGSECGEIGMLLHAADAAEQAARDFPDALQTLFRQGKSYPAAVCELVRRYCGADVAEVLEHPNNLLGVEYIRAIRKQNADITPLCIPRRYAGHDSMQTEAGFASASRIRAAVDAGEPVVEYLPAFTAALLEQRMQEGKTAHIRRLETVILCHLRTAEELAAVPDMQQDLLHRMLAARRADSVATFLERVKTRCCTMARIRRAMLCSLIGIRAEDLRGDVPYARILGCNDRGRELLRNSGIPANTSLARLRKTSAKAERIVELEARASDIYGLARERIGSAEDDFRAKIVKFQS